MFDLIWFDLICIRGSMPLTKKKIQRSESGTDPDPYLWLMDPDPGPKNTWIHYNCLLGSRILVIGICPNIHIFPINSALTQQMPNLILRGLLKFNIQYGIGWVKAVWDYPGSDTARNAVPFVLGFLLCWVTLNEQSIFWSIKLSLEKI